MLTEESTPNNLDPLFAKKSTKIQEKEDPVAVSEEEENSDSDADSDGSDLDSLFAKKPTDFQEEEDPVAVSEEEEYSDADGNEYSVDSEDNQDDESYIRHRQEKAELVVTDFLKQVQENQFGEFQWPPPPKCPTYKLGMTSPFTIKYWFENESHTGEDYDTAKKFLHQVRTSWGYDVDCIPPKWLHPRTLFPIDMADESLSRIFGERITSYVEFAIKRINTQAKVEIGKTFELVKTEKAVGTATTMLLLTLTVKETSSDAEKAIRVAVSSPFGCGPEIVECHLIPSLSSSSN